MPHSTTVQAKSGELVPSDCQSRYSTIFPELLHVGSGGCFARALKKAAVRAQEATRPLEHRMSLNSYRT